MQTLLFLSLLLGGISLILTGVTHFSVRVVCRKPRKPEHTPPITVLKPLKGDDDGLYENLVSLARQDYPFFEILFGCEDPGDPALVVARRVQREFSHVKIRVCSGATQVGLNPKVNTLAMLSDRASHDWLLISDSNVRARPDYLSAMATELADSRVGLVSSVLVGSGERSLGARFDNLHMNSCIVRAVCGADVVAAHPCVIGKSMLFRKSTLRSLGGFDLVRDVLAEDYVLGRAYREAGFRVVLSAHPLESVSVRRSMRDFCARHVRWSQMRRHLFPALYVLEPLQSPSPWFLLALAVLAYETSVLAAPALLATIVLGLLLRAGSDAAIARTVRGTPLTLVDHLAILFKDVLFIAIWVVGGLKRTVCWRGNRMRIGPGSRLLPLEEAARPRAAFEGA
jgi:ceramide glucosyltransferase